MIMNPEREYWHAFIFRWSGSLPDSQAAMEIRASSLTPSSRQIFQACFDLPISGAYDSVEFRIFSGLSLPGRATLFEIASVSG
jgi:hypothetical protein